MTITYRDGKPVTARRCWLLHSWTPWEQYDFRGAVTTMLGRPMFPPVEFSERRQRRTCVRCNKEQDEEVRAG